MDLEARINDVESMLNEIKDDMKKKNTVPIVGVKFMVEHVGRLSTKTLFFKGDLPLGEKVIITRHCNFIERNYGTNPVGIVVMNGNYATLMAEAEGFTAKDNAVLYRECCDGDCCDDVPITADKDDDYDFDNDEEAMN